MGKIVAIGGGEIGPLKEGESNDYPVETTAIDKEILSLTEKTHPNLLFLPTASYDSADYYKVAKKHFTNIGFNNVDVLYLSNKTLKESHIENTILSYDAIYVGGGNTLHMMKIWKRLGVDRILKQALDSNIVLSGVSAGSICWFNSGVSDSLKFSSGSNKLIKVSGLSYIDVLHCPHYNAGPIRQDALKSMTKKTAKVAVALDDCSALIVVDDKYKIITSKPDAKARKIYWKRGEYVVEEIKHNKDFREVQELIAK